MARIRSAGAWLSTRRLMAAPGSPGERNASDINDAITRLAALGGGELHLVDDEFVIESPIVLRSGVHVVGAVGGRSVLSPAPGWTGSTTDPLNAIVRATGSLNTSRLDTTLAARHRPGALTLSLTAAGTLAAGDWVLVGEDSALGSAQLRQVAASYAGGTSVPLDEPLGIEYASGVRVRSFDPLTDVAVRDLRLQSGGGVVAAGVLLRGVVGAKVVDLELDADFAIGGLVEDYDSHDIERRPAIVGVVGGLMPSSDFAYEEPLDRELHVYIKSDRILNGPDYIPGGDNLTANCGDDSNDGLSPERPLKTLAGLYRQYAQAADGYTVIVHLMGGEAASEALNVDSPVNGRAYATRQLLVGIGESWRCNFIYRGPRSGIKMGGVEVTLTSATDLGNGRTLLNASAGFGPMNTNHVRWTRDDGREVFFPFPVGAQPHVSGGQIIEACDATTVNTAIALGGGNRLSPITCGASIVSDGTDVYFRGVNVVGFGAWRAGGRYPGSSPIDKQDQNPFPLLERIQLLRATFNVVGSYLVDGCRFADHVYVTGEGRFRNCAVEGQVFWEGTGPHLINQFNSTTVMGRMLAYDPTNNIDVQLGAAMDPQYPHRGIDFVCSNEGALRVGRLGGRPGILRLIKGCSIYPAAAGIPSGAIRVVGPGSMLYMVDAPNGFPDWPKILIDSAQATDIGLWCLAGGQARILNNGNPPFTVNMIGAGAANTLKVGKQAAQTIAAFSGGTQNFLDAEDNSRIWSSAWEPAGYKEQ